MRMNYCYNTPLASGGSTIPATTTTAAAAVIADDNDVGRQVNLDNKSPCEQTDNSCRPTERNNHQQELNHKLSSSTQQSATTSATTTTTITTTTTLPITSDVSGCSNDIKTINDNESRPLPQQQDTITIIHFNDCYNVEPGHQSSGAAGFLTAINQFRHLNPMILFSGDILSPSFMSTFTKGEQMIPVLNDIGVDCAVFGNHEFDYGVDNLIEFVKKTTFPWLLSNVIDKETQNQLGDGLVYHLMERCGIKFGLIGLIEEEWLSTLSTLDSSDVIYEDFVTKGRQLARWLKSEPNNVDYVIALTHFRTPNDIRLADSVPEIDLILGGHDHDYEIIKRPNSYIIKSGTDFREFSKVTLKIDPNYKNKNTNTSQQQVSTFSNNNNNNESPEKPISVLDIEHVKCVGYEPNLELKEKLDKFVTKIDEKMVKLLGQFNCDLDGRFSSIRKSETNLGNFITDIMLASTHADLAILNSGTLRSDRIHPRGDFTMRDLFNILGYIDPIAVLQATGYHIWRALENGVSQWPKLEGRFPQVSGCSFKFDPSKPAGQRIDPKDITIGDEQLVLDKHYRLTTKAYLASGKDGYDMLKECKVLVPGDESPDLTTSILNHFEAINIVKSNRRTHHRQSIICLSRTSLQKILHQASDFNNAQVNGSPLVQPPTCYSPNPNQKMAECLAEEEAYNDDNNSSSARNTCTRVDEVDGNGSNNAFNAQQQPQQDSNNNTNNNQGNNSDGQQNNNYNNNNNSTTATFGDELVPAATGTLAANHLNVAQPATSSPLTGTKAPTPSLKTIGSVGSESPAAGASTPPSAIQQRSRQPRTKRLMSLYEMEHEQCKLEPKIEGRIRIIGIDA